MMLPIGPPSGRATYAAPITPFRLAWASFVRMAPQEAVAPGEAVAFAPEVARSEPLSQQFVGLAERSAGPATQVSGWQKVVLLADCPFGLLL